VNGIDIPDFGGGDNPVYFQVTLSAGTGSDADRFVGGLDVEGVVISLGVDGERANTHVFAGAYDTKGDFAAICD
jgi:hypothetical protein